MGGGTSPAPAESGANFKTMNSRRTFLAGAGAAVISHLPAASAMSANDRVRIAVLGVNGRGKSHISSIMKLGGAEVVVVCDPDLDVARKCAAEFEKTYGKKVQVEQDLRRVFDNKEIDAVTIGTPNHWHSLAAIWACQAGKDVYVEKPGSHNIFEGRKMVEAAHKYNRIVQHGVQLRSSEAIQEAVQHLRKGTIGNVYMARGLVYRWRPSIGHKGTEPVPETLNYDLWTGPAQQEPFSPPHRALQLALDLELRQRRRRQPGHPRDRHVHVGPGSGDAAEEDHGHGRQVPFRRR